ncbi:hypothetical protein MKX08_003454 [Trichoderma sp. CBMAI-0020]|nr:hypothetical protein MKX08_003454 [Trichoderma sp. CBMAI-0020]WOD46464.1 hypothetical protein [Trichoderma atroviride]
MENKTIAEIMSEMARNPPEDDWVQVPSRKSARARAVPDPMDAKAILELPTIRPSSTIRPASKEAIAGQHFYTLRAYKESRECRILRALINVFKAELEGAGSSEDPITKAICLGIGPFDPDNGSWIIKDKAHMQFAAFTVIVEELQTLCKNKIEVILQEPAFNATDIDFVTSLGHDVVESPIAFEAVDSKTFVFGIHLYRDIYAQVFQNRVYPALFVGTGWDIWCDVSYRWTEEEKDRLAFLEEMETTHKKFPFPESRGNNIFFGTSIFWK